MVYKKPLTTSKRIIALKTLIQDSINLKYNKVLIKKYIHQLLRLERELREEKKKKQRSSTGNAPLNDNYTPCNYPLQTDIPSNIPTTINLKPLNLGFLASLKGKYNTNPSIFNYIPIFKGVLI